MMRDYSKLTDAELIDKLFEASELCPPDGTLRRTDLCYEAGKRLLHKQLDQIYKRGL